MSILFVTVSPSGGGKSTINKRLVSELDNIVRSITYTTRAMRTGEQDGVNYNFISEAEFKAKIQNKDFLEYAIVHNKYYGTSVSKINECISKGIDVILEIDVQGAKQVKKLFKTACLIYILPPSFKILKERLMARKTETQEQITLRIDDAKKELEDIHDYDYIVVNNTLDKAVEDMKSVIKAKRLEVSENTEFLKQFMASVD